MWLFGQGPLVGDSAEVPMGLFSGADFPPDFDAASVVNTPWGTVSFTFTGPDSAAASWVSSVDGYADGNIQLTRLTELSGQACP